MKIKKYFEILCLLLSASLLLTGCAVEPEKSAVVYSIEETAENSFFKQYYESEKSGENSETEETTEETYLLEKLHGLDTEIRDSNGKMLVNLKNGQNIYSENAMNSMSGILTEISRNSVIAPRIEFSTKLDSELTSACYQLLETGYQGIPLEGCVVVSDFQNNILAIANRTNNIAYYEEIYEDEDKNKYYKLLIEDGDPCLELEKSYVENNPSVCSEINNPDSYIIIHEKPKDTNGEWSDAGTKYDLADLKQVHSNASYHSSGTYIGSTAKILASIVMMDSPEKFPTEWDPEHKYVYYDSSIDDFILKDTGNFLEYYTYPEQEKRKFSYENQRIRNSNEGSGNTVYNRITSYLLKEIDSDPQYNALSRSYNTFFARAYLQLGYENVIQSLNQCLAFNKFGDRSFGYYFPTDWGDLSMPDFATAFIGTTDSETDAPDAADPDFILARAGYGCAGGISNSLYQKNLTAGMSKDEAIANASINYFPISPLYLNTVVSTIASGKMNIPSIKKDTETTDIESILKQEEYSNSPYHDCQFKGISAEMRQKLWNVMKYTTDTHTGVDVSGYTIYTKTGTADYMAGKKNLVITGFMSKDTLETKDPEGYCITMFIKNGEDLNNDISHVYATTVKDVYQKICNTIVY